MDTPLYEYHGVVMYIATYIYVSVWIWKNQMFEN